MGAGAFPAITKNKPQKAGSLGTCGSASSGFRSPDPASMIGIPCLAQNAYCGLGSQVIDQARRRVLNGEQVPNAEKIYSIFEPHTDLIKRGKVRTPIEFRHQVFLAER